MVFACSQIIPEAEEPEDGEQQGEAGEGGEEMSAEAFGESGGDDLGPKAVEKGGEDDSREDGLEAHRSKYEGRREKWEVTIDADRGNLIFMDAPKGTLSGGGSVMANKTFQVTIAFFLLFVAVGLGLAQTKWVTSWASSQQVPEPRNALGDTDLQDTTLRQIVHLSLGGPQLRVKVSNRYGVAPLHLTSVHIAKPVALDSSAIVPETDKALSFASKPDVTIPAGADYLSDAIAYPMGPQSDLVITMHVAEQPKVQTSHPGSRATSYYLHGNAVSAAELKDAKTIEHWYFISGVEVPAGPDAAAVAIVGDSITDGNGSTTNGNNRWTDVLARRLQANATTKWVAVLNHGIGGGRILKDGLGPNAMARFNNDVLAQAGIKYVIVFEGINDIGTLSHGNAEPPAPPAKPELATADDYAALVHNITAAYQQMINRAHDHGIRIYGATILPYAESFYYKHDPQGDKARQAINEWIRTPGHFDAVIDLDKALRDPAHPEQLLPEYDKGDHLHPSVAGHAAIGNAVPLELLKPGLKMAITFDDLPAHSELPPGVTRQQVADKTIAALKEAQVPSVYGFVNGKRLEEKEGPMSVLESWRAAGFPLGNHTWSHMNLNENTAAAFEAEVAKNEDVLKKLMGDQDWKWLRYPYLREGDTPEKRDEVRAFLAKRGYKVAQVTMSFGDYQWNEPYARCMKKGDKTAIALLQASYLAAADEAINRYRDMSEKVNGRDIPYVLLMHIGALDAEMLPRLLALYKARGFEFVTLPDAESDPFYRDSMDPSLPAVPDTLEGAMNQQGIPFPARGLNNPKFEEMCK